MLIPKIIHQTWKQEPLPETFKILSDTWKEHHSEWQYMLWTDEDNRELIKNSFPFFLSIYDNYSLNIQRADAVRYFILYKYGGVYVDMDFECFENLEPLLKGEECVFTYQPEDHCKMFKMDMIVCNAFMASIPKHSFLKLLIDDMFNNTTVIEDPNDRVLQTTGPFMVTRVYLNSRNDNNIKILESSALYPLTGQEVISYYKQGDNPDEIFVQKLQDAYGVHYWLNTWTDWDALRKKNKSINTH